MIGQTLGHSRIVELIGAGSQCEEAYEAADTRLDCTVAIKVLPDLFAPVPNSVGSSLSDPAG